MSASVAVILGSNSDLSAMKSAFELLRELGIKFEARVLSAHRTPDAAAAYAKNAEERGIKVIICAAGMAAHLAGVIASYTILPVIGVPLKSEPFGALDALLAMVQMPPGIPVATVTAGPAGAKNAALSAAAILALSDPGLTAKLKAFRAAQARKVEQADAGLQQELGRA